MPDGHFYTKIITTGVDKSASYVSFYAKATGLFMKIFGQVEVQLSGGVIKHHIITGESVNISARQQQIIKNELTNYGNIINFGQLITI